MCGPLAHTCVGVQAQAQGALPACRLVCRLAAQVLPPVSEKKFTEGHPKLKICVTGAGGFIASHLSKRLKEEGHFVRAVDWKENEHRRTS